MPFQKGKKRMSEKNAQDKILQSLEPKGKAELSLTELEEKTELPKTTLHRNLISLKDDQKKIKQRIATKEKGIGEKTVFYIPPTLEERMQEAIDKVLKIQIKDGTCFYIDYMKDSLHKIAVLMEMSEDDIEFKNLFAKFENRLKLKPFSSISVS